VILAYVIWRNFVIFRIERGSVRLCLHNMLDAQVRKQSHQRASPEEVNCIGSVCVRACKHRSSSSFSSSNFQSNFFASPVMASNLSESFRTLSQRRKTMMVHVASAVNCANLERHSSLGSAPWSCRAIAAKLLRNRASMAARFRNRSTGFDWSRLHRA
jgi:hypothetical protein